ncbi:predicted protein [Nematostella vectensis]|uniref:5'-nucleotidase n=1 Tax=Nematostella vectensis TaxID=45351 RepID=A7SFU1_NEMVE|nr:predicted protein [Nematostella vectensis]|eukprot:XP_001629473.1 predicted protein [Nematostella vectensis]
MAPFFHQIQGLDKPSVYIIDPVGLREKLCRIYEAGPDKLQIVTDFDKTLTKFIMNGTQGCTVHGVLETSKYFPESYREKCLALRNHYHPIELSGISPEEKGPLMVEWWTKAHDLITELNLKKEDLPKILRDANIGLRDGVEWLFVKTYEKNVPVFILSGGLGDIIEEVIKQQSHLFDNVTVMANYMKFNEEGVMVGLQDELISSNNKREQTRSHPYFEKHKDRTNVVVMGDLIQDTDVVGSLKAPENVLTIGLLNEKVDERLSAYKEAFDVVVVDDHSIEVVDEVLMQLLHQQ